MFKFNNKETKTTPASLFEVKNKLKISFFSRFGINFVKVHNKYRK